MMSALVLHNAVVITVAISNAHHSGVAVASRSGLDLTKIPNNKIGEKHGWLN
jgi:hypothetical protein